MENNTIDIWLKQSSLHGEVPFNDNDWADMKKLLEKKKKRRFLFWWLFIFLSASLITGGGFLLYNNQQGTNKTRKQTMNQSGLNRGEKNNMYENTVSKNDSTAQQLKIIHKTSTGTGYDNSTPDRDSVTKAYMAAFPEEQRPNTPKAKSLTDRSAHPETLKQIEKKKDAANTRHLMTSSKQRVMASVKKEQTLQYITEPSASVKKVDKRATSKQTDSATKTAANIEPILSVTGTEKKDTSQKTTEGVFAVNDSIKFSTEQKNNSRNKKVKPSSFFYAGIGGGTTHPFSKNISPNLVLSYNPKITNKLFVSAGIDMSRAGSLGSQEFFQVVSRRPILGTTSWRIHTQNTTVNIRNAWAFSPFLGLQYQAQELGLAAGIQYQQLIAPKLRITHQQDSFLVQGADADRYLTGPAYNAPSFTGKKNTYIYYGVSYCFRNKYVLGANARYMLHYNQITGLTAIAPRRFLFNLSAGIKFYK